MKKQVFLGGACGTTTWRKDVAIPILSAAGVTFHDPQLGVGEWTAAHEAADMRAKAAADVLLFVIGNETRGVAGIAEVAYLIALGQPLALVVQDITAGTLLAGRVVDHAEQNDLNRGRLFVRTMAQEHGVPVFTDIAEASHYAVLLTQHLQERLTLEEVRNISAEVKCAPYRFVLDEVAHGFTLQLQAEITDVHTGLLSQQYGRLWHIERTATRNEVVRTAFKAVVTWLEHEAREQFTYQNAHIFGPHLDIAALVELARKGNG